ncbi:hypothetical protein J14TS2_16130 [Bacillus sp. J14TS2]|uniref:hypothetical protein n=1 Tax=Bacillus sp. J14TS2 TaxID=2807188 RepID=UPI001B05B3AE|nr:hypothetical protein [Bacillus sp. J14TS2]GIN71138.1 hypothetical protein J14TS2_16130 [Bacillus sp. J14TS2]
MIKLKLKNALSYNGSVSANSRKPNVEVKTKKEADNLVSSGYFEIVEDEKKEEE